MNEAIGPKAIVVGGGIAGVSAAAALAAHPSAPQVTLVEAESQLAQHTTGRSAAQFIQNYGASPLRALSQASRAAFDGLLSPRPVLMVAGEGQDQSLDDALAEGAASGVEEITVAEALEWFPRLDPEAVSRATIERSAADIDVAALHQRLLATARAAGVEVRTGSSLVAAQWVATRGWDVDLTDASEQVDLIINCAGAWGDLVAERCGVEPVGLEPKRRTAFMVASPDGAASGAWPLLVDVDHRWYCKPDGSQFLCSPADETPSQPCDARPDELDVALGIDRINASTTLNIRSVRSSWAGLRTFAPDRSMVIGPDPTLGAFVWSVGQGGTGIQTAPAAGWLTADLALGGQPGCRFDAVELDLAGLVPDRLR